MSEIDERQQMSIERMRQAAHSFQEAGQNKTALLLIEGALRNAEALYGRKHAIVSSLVSDLARLKAKVESPEVPERAEASYKRALNIKGKEHPETLRAANNLGLALIQAGRLDEAEALLLELHQIRSRLLGDEHIDTLRALYNLAGVFKVRKEWDRYLSILSRVVDGETRSLGAGHTQVRETLSELVGELYRHGSLAAAEEARDKLVELEVAARGVLSSETLYIVRTLRALQGSYGDEARAADFERRFMERRLGAVEAALKDDEKRKLSALSVLAIDFDEGGHAERALELQRHIVERRTALLGQDDQTTLISTDNLAYILSKKGDFAEARKLHARALEGLVRAHGEEHEAALRCLGNYSRTLRLCGDLSGAQHALERLVEIYDRSNKTNLAVLRDLIEILLAQENLQRARDLQAEVIEGTRRLKGDGAVDTMAALERLTAIDKMIVTRDRRKLE